MPLVTRQANQGLIFKQDLEPSGSWLDGDLWSDTTENLLKLNVGGTATEVGVTIAFDNALISLTASQTDTTIPASGETDFLTVQNVTNAQTGDRCNFSSDSGTTFLSLRNYSADNLVLQSADRPGSIQGIGNSTGRYNYVMDAGVATRTILQVITTLS